MKKLLHVLVFALFSVIAYAQPSVVWSEDFSGGSEGWTVTTSLCGNITGDAIGRWTLTSATVNGTAVPGLTGEFSVNTAVDYSVKFSDGTNRAEAQARYTLANNVWTSNLNGEAIPLADTNWLYNTTNRQTLYFTSLNMTQSAFDSWGGTFLGLNSPTFTISGTTLTVASSNGAVQLVFTKASNCGVLWWWSPNGSVRAGALFNAATGELTINSPSNTNGAMVINADFLTTRGLSSGVPSGPPPYPQYTTELISPVIDLSGVSSRISLTFFQLVRILNVSSDSPGAGLRTSVAFSTDGGTTWSTPINANEGLATNATPLQVERLLNLPDIQGSANARIKFTWSADFYYWAIDDIKLIEQPRNDMRVNPFYAIPPNASTPVSQLEPFGFIADIENVGSMTQPASTLKVTISDASSQAIYADSIQYGSIAADSVAENVFFPTEYTPPATPGVYTGRYSLTLDGVDDERPENNFQEFSFTVTDSTFSKELGTSLGNFFASGNASYSWGNIYYVPNGDGFFAKSVSFAVGNATALANRSVTILLYKWNGDQNDNNRVDAAEYDSAPISFNSYTFTGSEGTNLITVPVDIDGNLIALEDNSQYMIALQYTTEDATTMQIRAANRPDFTAAWFYSDSLQRPRYGSAIDGGNTGSYGLVFTVMPIIRLHVLPTVSSVNENQLPEAAFEVFPNPASDRVSLRLTLDKPEDVQIIVFDQYGRTLTLRRFEQVSRDIIDMPVHMLPAGTYYIKVVTPSGAAVRPVVITR